MNQLNSADIEKIIADITLIYDDNEVFKANNFAQWLDKKHPGKNLQFWSDVRQNTFKTLQEKNVSYNDLPEPEKTDFFESIKITACSENFSKELTFYLTMPFFQHYQECQKTDFLNAKKALEDNLITLMQKSKKEEHLTFKKTFFGIPEIAAYFGSFIFNMKNQHSGKYELSINKKIHFPTSVEDKHNSAIFRFMDCVDEAFKKATFDSQKNLVNKEEIIRNIFLPQIWNGCGYCNSNNFVTFNHSTGTVDEVSEKKCSFAKKDVSKQVSEITTTGKLIFCNDVRNLFSFKDTLDKISAWGIENNVSTYVNTWEGQQGNMQAYANLFNVGYIQAGNHGACLKKTKKGLDVTYGKEEGLKTISLSLWAVCFIDYDKAVELAGSEKKLLNKLKNEDHYIVDVKPGTYQVINDCNVHEDKAYKSKKDLAFGKVVWLHE